MKAYLVACFVWPRLCCFSCGWGFSSYASLEVLHVCGFHYITVRIHCAPAALAKPWPLEWHAFFDWETTSSDMALDDNPPSISSSVRGHVVSCPKKVPQISTGLARAPFLHPPPPAANKERVAERSGSCCPHTVIWSAEWSQSRANSGREIALAYANMCPGDYCAQKVGQRTEKHRKSAPSERSLQTMVVPPLLGVC